MKPAEAPRKKVDKITKYIRYALAIYIISMATTEACQCIHDYDRDTVNSKAEIGKILNDTLDDIVEEASI